MHTVGFRGSVPQLLDTPGSLGEQLREAVADRTSRFNDGVASSNLQVDRADRYGRRASRTTLALAFLASAGALFGLAGVLRAGRAGWLSLATGMLGLLAAGALGIIAFVT
jgi:hypothetical protein